MYIAIAFLIFAVFDLLSLPLFYLALLQI